jgi:hypothetical protein
MLLRLFFAICFFITIGAEELILKNNLALAKPGDFLVAAQGSTITLLRIHENLNKHITIEEVTIPANRVNRCVSNWRNWYESEASGNTSWVIYQIDLNTAEMMRYFSYTKNGWYQIPQVENFLATLLNLSLHKVPLDQRRKVGAEGFGQVRSIWQPQMIVDGHTIENVPFDAYRTRWPNDGTILSGKSVEIYLPQANTLYPAYFPYWLQISGLIGKARLRIIDSGANLTTPKAGFPR